MEPFLTGTPAPRTISETTIRSGPPLRRFRPAPSRLRRSPTPCENFARPDAIVSGSFQGTLSAQRGPVARFEAIGGTRGTGVAKNGTFATSQERATGWCWNPGNGSSKAGMIDGFAKVYQNFAFLQDLRKMLCRRSTHSRP